MVKAEPVDPRARRFTEPNLRVVTGQNLEDVEAEAPLDIMAWPIGKANASSLPKGGLPGTVLRRPLGPLT